MLIALSMLLASLGNPQQDPAVVRLTDDLRGCERMRHLENERDANLTHRGNPGETRRAYDQCVRQAKRRYETTIRLRDQPKPEATPAPAPASQ